MPNEKAVGTVPLFAIQCVVYENGKFCGAKFHSSTQVEDFKNYVKVKHPEQVEMLLGSPDKEF